MANLGDKLSFGDLDGVVTRAVKVAGGTEYTVVVPDEDSARPVSVSGYAPGNGDEQRLTADDDKAEADNKAAADRKAAADKAAATKPATGTKAAGSK